MDNGRRCGQSNDMIPQHDTLARAFDSVQNSRSFMSVYGNVSAALTGCVFFLSLSWSSFVVGQFFHIRSSISSLRYGKYRFLLSLGLLVIHSMYLADAVTRRDAVLGEKLALIDVYRGSGEHGIDRTWRPRIRSPGRKVLRSRRTFYEVTISAGSTRPMAAREFRRKTPRTQHSRWWKSTNRLRMPRRE